MCVTLIITDLTFLVRSCDENHENISFGQRTPTHMHYFRLEVARQPACDWSENMTSFCKHSAHGPNINFAQLGPKF